MNINYLIVIVSLLCLSSAAQKSDFIVTSTYDTIYVDKITLTDFKVKTKTAEKRKNYSVEDVISYYVSEENKHFERVLNRSEKKVFKDADRYDYKRIEGLHIEDYENRIKYKFFQRLTDGKVKLFCEILEEGGTVTTGLPYSSGVLIYETNVYYLSISNTKLERIKYSGKFELNDEVYDILKVYLHGNDKIQSKLESLRDAVPPANEKQIIALINAYNVWIKSNQ